MIYNNFNFCILVYKDSKKLVIEMEGFFVSRLNKEFELFDLKIYFIRLKMFNLFIKVL